MVLGTTIGDFRNMSWLLGAMFGVIAISRLLPSKEAWIPSPDVSKKVLPSLLLGYFVAAGMVTLLKIGFDLPRSAAAMPYAYVAVLAPPESRHSFPSGHSAIAMLVMTVFWSHLKICGRSLMAVFTLWVGISRINVGAHFPADVLGGYLCGAASGLLANKSVMIWQTLKYRHRQNGA